MISWKEIKIDKKSIFSKRSQNTKYLIFYFFKKILYTSNGIILIYHSICI